MFSQNAVARSTSEPIEPRGSDKDNRPHGKIDRNASDRERDKSSFGKEVNLVGPSPRNHERVRNPSPRFKGAKKHVLSREDAAQSVCGSYPFSSLALLLDHPFWWEVFFFVAPSIPVARISQSKMVAFSPQTPWF